MAAAELILQPPVDPLGSCALGVATLLGKDEAEGPPRRLLTLQRLLHVDRAARVHVDDRLVAQRDAVRPDLDGIVGRVHQVIEALDPTGRQGSQRDRHLGVVGRRRRHDAADGDPAVGRVDVQLVADPGGPVGPWRCAWYPHRRTSAGPPASAAGSSSVAVPDGSGSFDRSSPLRGRPRLRRSFGSSAFGFAAGFSRASIAVASREMCSTRWPSIVRAISVSCRRLARPLSANSAKARENVASLGSRPPPFQPQRPAQPAVNLKTLDQRPASSERRTPPWR